MSIGMTAKCPHDVFWAQNNIVSGIFASNLLRLKNHQLFRELLPNFLQT